MKFEGIISYVGTEINVLLKVDDVSVFDSKLERDITKSYIKKTECLHSVFFMYEDTIVNEDQTLILSSAAENSFKKNIPSFPLLNYNQFQENIFNLDLDFGCWINPSKGIIYLVRGIFGIIPLYFYQSSSKLIFSSSYSDLIYLVKSERTLTLNKAAIYNYVARRDWGKLVSSKTFFNELNSVYPGHTIAFKEGSFEMVSYLNYHPEKYFSFNKDVDQLIDLFKDKLSSSLEKIVKDSVDNKQPIGTQLSGGLDSSALSGLLRYIYPESSIKAFFLQATPYENVDNYYSDLVVNHINAQQIIVNPPNDIKDMFVSIIKDVGMPIQSVSSGMPGFFMRESALQYNSNILVSGQGGDEVTGYGRGYLNQLYHNNDWKEIRKICDEIAKRDFLLSKDRTLSLKSEEIFSKIIFSFLRQKKEIKSTFQKLYSIGSISIVKYYFSSLLTLFFKGRRTRPFKDKEFLNKNFYNSVPIDSLDEGNLDSSTLVTESGIDFKTFYASLFININEVNYAMNLTHEVKVHMPFLDKDLLELSLAIPSKVKFDNALLRGHLRAAMKDILPEEVRLREGKFAFNYLVKSIGIKLHYAIGDLLSSNAFVWEFANYKFYIRSVQLLESSSELDMELFRRSIYVLRVINLAVWLDEFKNVYNEKH